MNRRFRGKRNDNGEWVYGYYTVIKGTHYISYEVPGEMYFDIIVDPATVGQFTGLYDATKWESLTDAEKQTWLNGYDESGKRNTAETWRGREIWEGDIVQWTWLHEKRVAVIKWNEERAMFTASDRRENLLRAVKVIGNVFDNPEIRTQ